MHSVSKAGVAQFGLSLNGTIQENRIEEETRIRDKEKREERDKVDKEDIKKTHKRDKSGREIN